MIAGGYGNVNFKAVEKLIGTFKAQPRKTIFMLLVYLLILVVSSYLSAFFAQKGKQHSISPSTNIGTATAPKEAVVEKKTNNDRAIINQRTQGDQSPAVVSGGNVIIEYDTRKDKNKKE